MSVILSILYVCVPIYLSLLSCNCPLSLLFPSCWLSKEKWCKIFVIYWWWCLALATVPPCQGSHLDPFLIPPSSPALKLNIFIHLEGGGGGCDFPRHLHLTIRFVSVVATSSELGTRVIGCFFASRVDANFKVFSKRNVL